jgi:hypothetical protein
MEPETTPEPTKKPFDRNAYMRAYYKKRRAADPVFKEKLNQTKRDYYRAKKGQVQFNPEIYGLNARDALTLRSYYEKMLLLEPTCVADIILEFGLPEMPAF